MFDLSLGELALVVIAAVVFIGPKELPSVIRALATAMRHLRSLASEIRRAFDDLAKESGVKELEEGMRLIRGDDGKMYEAYDMPKKRDDSITG